MSFLTLRDDAAHSISTQKRGVPVECIIAHGAGHGFSGSEINPSVAEINRRTVAFFLKYLTTP